MNSLENDLLRLYAAHAHELRHGSRMEINAGVVRICLTIVSGIPDTPLTPCEEDIIRVLTEADRKLTKKEIAQAFEAEQTLWADSTISNALAEMVNRGILENRRDRKGYGLAKPT